MAKFLLEVSHQPNEHGCTRAVEAFLHSSSHFLTHADWGCKDDEHKAWLILDADDKEQAMSIVPVPYRTGTKVIKLSKFSKENIKEILTAHVH